jgi:hypothetical protein
MDQSFLPIAGKGGRLEAVPGGGRICYWFARPACGAERVGLLDYVKKDIDIFEILPNVSLSQNADKF